MRRRRLLVIAGVLALVGSAAACRQPGSGGPATKVPTVSGPVTGGKLGIPFGSALPSILDPAGYREDEFFISGTAQSYAPQGTLGADGRWTLRNDSTAAFKSRIIVRRPQDPAKFSGNVLVEWLNVSGGIDVDPDFGFLHPEIFDSGDAFVSVSAQKVGVDGNGIPLGGTTVPGLTKWDPQRYGSLVHPGDPYSYDIFSQAGRAVKQPGAVDPLGGLEARKVIAAGESQSAMRMFNYVNGVHPLAKVYDGFLIHSRMAGGGFGAQNVAAAQVRTDIDVPVMQFITETDLALFFTARQPDNPKLRTWEVAGTAHADKALQDYQLAAMARSNPGQPLGDPLGCKNINDGPQRFVVRRAYADLKRWVDGGAAPAASPRITATSGTAISRDPLGLALGGIRTPAVDVPVAVHSGVSTATGGNAFFCGLFGSTVPFDAATLRSLYPDHQDYVAKVTASAGQAVTAGFLRQGDVAEIVATAQAAPVPPQ
jgi:hypothetical protein